MNPAAIAPGLLESSPLAEELQTHLAAVEEELRRLLSVNESDLARAVLGVLARPAKRLRPLLAILGSLAKCGRVDRAVTQGAAAVEALHLATLLHDDVMDEAPVRSGRPTPNVTLGEHGAVLLGDFFFARALAGAERLGRPFLRRFLATAEALVAGEYGQGAAAGILPDIEHYLAWIERKTARLFALAASPGRAAEPVLERYGRAFGLAYQLRDDLQDLLANEAALGKPAMNDCRRGLYTYPVIVACARDPRCLAILRDARPDEEDWRAELRAILERTGALAAANEARRQWIAQALASLADLPPGPARTALAELAEWAAPASARLPADVAVCGTPHSVDKPWNGRYNKQGDGGCR